MPAPVVDVTPYRYSSSPPETDVRATFERDLDETTLKEAFTISPTVVGEFNAEGATLIFTPDEPLAVESTYLVTISTALLDAVGNPLLTQPYSWDFRIPRREPSASFGYGPNAQVVDVDGRRALQFSLEGTGGGSSADLAAVRFDLYSLTREQFLDRYASGFRGVAGNENQPIVVDDLPLVANWETKIPASDGASYGQVAEAQIPPDVPPGLYVLDLNGGTADSSKSDDQLIVLLTRHVVMLKQIEGEIAAWVTDINAEAGAGVAGATVGVYARNGELVAEGTTDGDGIFHTDVPHRPAAADRAGGNC